MSTAAFGRSKSGDRFYNPPARRQLQLQQQQQQQQQQQLLLQQKQQDKDEIRVTKLHNHQFNHNQRNRRRSKPAEVAVGTAASESVRVKSSSEIKVELDDCASTATTTPVETPVASVSSSSSSSMISTNFDRFLQCTTPSVHAHYFSKTSRKGWRNQKDALRPYFVLGDLWDSFEEWSAYGTGVPLLLNEGDSVVQYYVPFLSGIQLYIDPSKPSPGTRRPGEESDESFRDTSSDGSSDCETEKASNSFGVWRQQELAESTLEGMNGLSLRGKPLNGSSSDEGESSSSPGVLVFEYFSHDSPFSREPLANKISHLASHFPELMTYRSYELSPSSWISVAWYPIYRIPTGPTLQNFDSCFLTFHSLSTPLSGRRDEWRCHFGSVPSYRPNGLDMDVKLPLPTFGLAYYKFKIPIWEQNGVDESPKVNSLVQAADEWLRHLNVNHPDYRFFSSHYKR
ncbi:hypothetical protein RND81_12G137500 [Saponaria officinalis]|uniref:Uncharacterized protein n=1 Tax=Saponaria officinalis TaxID=3572 RepID=A0AAW1HAB0_SAPOF